MKGGGGTKLENQLGPGWGEPLGEGNLRDEKKCTIQRGKFILYCSFMKLVLQTNDYLGKVNCGPKPGGGQVNLPSDALGVGGGLEALGAGDPNIFALSEIRDIYIKRGTLRLCIWMCDAALALQFI